MTTARPELNREVATTADGMDITRGYTGPLMLPFDSVLRNRGGYDLQIYEQVLSDPEVKATFGSRQDSVVACEWQVEPGGKRAIDRAAADHLRDQLHDIGWDNVTRKMHFGVFYGYAPAEIIYKADGNRIAMSAIKVRNRRRFRFGKDGDLRLLTQSHMAEGIPAPAPYFWNYCAGADHDDEPYGLGLAHWLYWPVLFKRNGLKFWLIFLEKFGMPTAVGKYDENATAEERNRLLGATRAIQTDSGIIMPKAMEVDLLEAGRSGTADYKALQDYMDATIQKVVLGQTASTQGTAGKLGNDELQAEVRRDIIKADADLICESFTKGPARWLTEMNFPGAEVPRVYRVTDEAEDLDAAASRDEKLYRLGYRPKPVYIEQTYGPNYELREPPAEPQTPPTAIDDARFADPEKSVLALLRRHYPAAFAEADGQQFGSMTAQLDRSTREAGAAWVQGLQQLTENATSLEELYDQVLAAAPEMSLEEFANGVALGLSAAHLRGRDDAQRAAGG